jgi:hypothetical protein
MIKCAILSTGVALATPTALDLAHAAALDHGEASRVIERSRLRAYCCYGGRCNSNRPLNVVRRAGYQSDLDGISL